MADNLDRALGSLEARTDAHDERLKRIEAKLDHIVSIIDQSSGGLRMLAAVGALGGVVGGFLVKVIGWKLGQ